MSQVLLLGGDVAAFAAALEIAEVGVKVWIADAGVRVPEYGVRDPGGEVSALLSEVAAPLTPGARPNPGAALRQVDQPTPCLRGRDGAWKQAPAPAVWGIPTVPLARACIDILGMRGALRAYLDRLKPVLTIGKEANFGRLVETRLGSSARELLVEPLVFERFGIPAGETEVALVEPGLNEALTRAGSLSGGALQQLEQHAARETIVQPLAGWAAFGELLIERLTLFGAEPFPHGIRSCEAASDRGDRGDGDAGGAGARGWIVTDSAGVRHRFDAVLGDVADLTDVVVSNPSEPLPVGGSVDARPLGELLSGLFPTRTRQYVEIGIYDAAAASAAEGTPVRLCLVNAPGGGVWAAHTEAGPTGTTRMRLSGPVEAAGVGSVAPLAEAAAALGVSLAAEDAVVRTRTAACATAAERSAQLAAREAFADAHGEMLPLGESLHGGNLGAAIGEARERAVRLRRKLTGISE